MKMENNKEEEHLKNLSEIRSLMERSSSFMSLSGLSGIFAGFIAIAAFIITYIKLVSFYERPAGFNITLEKREDAIMYFTLIAVLTLILTFLEVIYFTSRKAKAKGLPVWDGSAKRLLFNLFVPLVTGGIFCILLVYQEIYKFIPSSMLLFYGLALLNASKYTLHDIRYLGISQLILGLMASFWLDYGLWFWVTGFGLMNIVYGILMYLKYE
jgi:hypothetical protein